MRGRPRACRWTVVVIAGLFAVGGAGALLLATRLSAEKIVQKYGNGNPASPSITMEEATGYLGRLRTLGVAYLMAGVAVWVARRRLVQALMLVLESASTDWARMRGGLAGSVRSGELLGVVALTVLAAGFRAPLLNDAIRSDEATSSIYFVQRGVPYIMLAYYTNNHILYNAITSVAVELFGLGPMQSRLICFLSGCLLVPLVYVAARAIWGRATAVLGATLVASWPYFVFLSINARGYTLMMCFFAVCLGLCPHLRRTNSAAGWTLFAASGALGLFTIPVMVYPLIGLAALLLASAFREPVAEVAPSRFLMRGAWAGVLCTALFVGLYTPAMIKSGYIAMFNNEQTIALPWSAWVGGLPGFFIYQWESAVPALPLWTAVVVGFLMAVEMALPRGRRAIAPSPLPPMLASLAIVITIQRLLPPPRVFGFLHLLCLLAISAGAVELIRRIARPVREGPILRWAWGLAAATAVLLGVAVFHGRLYDLDETGTCRDGRQIAAFLRTLPPKDLLLLGGFSEDVVTYYFRMEGAAPLRDGHLLPRTTDGVTWLVIPERDDLEHCASSLGIPPEIIPAFQEFRRFPRGGRLFRYEGPSFPRDGKPSGSTLVGGRLVTGPSLSLIPPGGTNEKGRLSRDQ